MVAKAPSHMEVVKRDQKAARLKAFIREYFTDSAAMDSGDHPHQILIVASSIDSPVICALKSVFRETEMTGYTIRLILARIGSRDLKSELQPIGLLAARWAENAKLRDAHEQLVLGNSTSWTGDCMRREPTKRDAFESFITDCSDTTAWARKSFERLWDVSRPVQSSKPANKPTNLLHSTLMQKLADKDADVIVGTRH
ncbi:MAG: hypothetical protein ACR2PG_15570 [Hyphomicrobiaceae bacterium]